VHSQVKISNSTFRTWLNLPNETDSCNPPNLDEHDITLFSTNDYLGLSTHPSVRKAVLDAVSEYGMGPRASPLVSGHTHIHAKLESALARLKGAEDCLLFPTGFAANMAVMSALAAGDVAVFSDELNHASIIDGIRLASRSGDRSRGEQHVYRHNDVGHLRELLRSSGCVRKLVVTDSLFSMDGDLAPLRELAALRREEGFLLVVDEAHATLVFGDKVLLVAAPRASQQRARGAYCMR
jgi:8-amino-7-oxononanoate synthase